MPSKKTKRNNNNNNIKKKNKKTKLYKLKGGVKRENLAISGFTKPNVPKAFPTFPNPQLDITASTTLLSLKDINGVNDLYKSNNYLYIDSSNKIQDMVQYGDDKNSNYIQKLRYIFKPIPEGFPLLDNGQYITLENYNIIRLQQYIEQIESVFTDPKDLETTYHGPGLALPVNADLAIQVSTPGANVNKFLIRNDKVSKEGWTQESKNALITLLNKYMTPPGKTFISLHMYRIIFMFILSANPNCKYAPAMSGMFSPYFGDAQLVYIVNYYHPYFNRIIDYYRYLVITPSVPPVPILLTSPLPEGVFNLLDAGVNVSAPAAPASVLQDPSKPPNFPNYHISDALEQVWGTLNVGKKVSAIVVGGTVPNVECEYTIKTFIEFNTSIISELFVSTTNLAELKKMFNDDGVFTYFPGMHFVKETNFAKTYKPSAYVYTTFTTDEQKYTNFINELSNTIKLPKKIYDINLEDLLLNINKIIPKSDNRITKTVSEQLELKKNLMNAIGNLNSLKAKFGIIVEKLQIISDYYKKNKTLKPVPVPLARDKLLIVYNSLGEIIDLIKEYNKLTTDYLNNIEPLLGELLSPGTTNIKPGLFTFTSTITQKLENALSNKIVILLPDRDWNVRHD